MTIERSFDFELIWRLITHPKSYPFASDDFSTPPQEFAVHIDDRIWYVLAYDRGELLGGFMFVPQNTICWEIHLMLLPASWGRRSVEALRSAIAWVFENTPCLRIVGATPAYLRLAIRLAHRAGMTQFGVNEKAFLKNGILHDLILSGVSKES